MKREQRRRVHHRRGGQGMALGEQEKRRLLQLGICLLLFLTVFFTRGLDRLAGVRESLSDSLGTSVDIQGILAVLRGDVAQRASSPREALSRLWSGLFLPRERPADQGAGDQSRLYREAGAYLSGGAGGLLTAVSPGGLPAQEDPMASSVSLPEPEVVLVDYTGPGLPDNTSMDRYALHLGSTITPVLSHVTSPFGWREDPMERGERFHYGLDLAAPEGTDVLAFAAGTVDYIGEGESYGMYLQLDHGGGVKSFYAHCSRLCVQKGQQIAAGEKVAETGATGYVTGPHLHFELKRGDTRLNPAYYIDFAS